MNETLRPSTLGEILDRTANLYRSRFLVFFGLAAIPAGVVLGFAGGMVLLMTWSGALSVKSTNSNPEAIAAMILGVTLLGLVALPLTIGGNALCGAALCHAASTVVLGGRIAIASSLKAVWKRGWHYTGLFLLQGVIIFGVPFALWMALLMLTAIGVAVTAGGGGGSAGGLLGGVLVLLMFLGLTVYVVWMLLQICLAFPVAVVESAGIGVALKRAWQLCKGTRWRMLALFALVMALSQVASLLVLFPLVMLMALIPGFNSPQNSQLVGTVFLIGAYGMSFVVNALTMPVVAIALVLFYYDQRVRKEGFDIELLMQQAGMIAMPPAAPEQGAWIPAGAQAVEIDAATAMPAREDKAAAGPEPAEPGGGASA
jgi:hypothetical protein